MKMKSPVFSSLCYSVLVIGSLVLLVAFPAAAAAGANTGASVIAGVETIPSNKATLVTMTGPGRWYAVDFEQDGLVCGDGKTPFSILFKRATAGSGPSTSSTSSSSTKWLIEFEGGRTPTCWLDSSSNNNKCGCPVTPDRLRPSWSDRPVPSPSSSSSSSQSSSSGSSSWSQDANIDFTVEMTTATSPPIGTTSSSVPSSSSSSSGSSQQGQGADADGIFMVLDDIPVCQGWSQGLVQDDLQALFELEVEDRKPGGGAAAATGSTSATVTYDLPIPLRPVDSTMNGDWWQGSIQDDFNYVLVPDCTADSHLGFSLDAIEYDNSSCDVHNSDGASTTTSVYHRGGMNRQAVIDWIATAASASGGIDALVTVAGGRPLGGNDQCGGSSSHQSSVSSIAPVLATSQAVTTLGLDIETLTIQDGAGLQRLPLPTQTEMQESWKIEDDELFTGTVIESDNFTDRQKAPYDIQDVAVQLITDLVSSKTSKGDSSPNTVVWIAPSNKDDQTTLFDPLISQDMPIHVYQAQPVNIDEQETSCPRFAFPRPSDSFSEFLTTQVAWNPEMKMMSQSVVASYTTSASSDMEGGDGDGDGRGRLSFLSVVLILIGVVVIIYIAYFALRRRRLNQNQSPPPSPVDLWFWCLTQYPGTFLAISLLIPVILAVAVIVQQDGQINVNLDFDSYLEINTPLENTRRVYEWKQRQQWQSNDFEEDQCAYINSAGGPNRLLSQHESQDENIQVSFEHLDIAKAIDWDFVLQQANNSAAGTDEHQRKLDMANLLYYSGGEVISIMYTNPKGGNVFEPAALQEIYQFEQSIYNFPGFVNYCFGFGGNRCLPIDSLVTHFFTSSGSLKTMETETITRNFLGNQPALWKLDQYFGPNNLGSNVTRSFVFFRNVGGDQSAAHPFLKRFYTDLLWKNQRKYKNMVFTWDNHYLKDLEAQEALRHDSLWSIGSLCFIALMIAFKVRNLFVTVTAMSSLILSFFAAYYYVSAHFAIENATLLWVAGLFVMLGIGADDIFLMVDSFEHAKSTGEDEAQPSKPSNRSVGSDADINICEDPKSLEDSQRETIRRVMIKAYRQAGGMMAVSSVTTAVCFFSNAFGILVVIQEFGIFMGMVVLINYIHVMTILPSALLVDSFYVLPMRRRFQGWCASKLGINSTEHSKTVSSTEEEDFHANIETIPVQNMTASPDRSEDEIPDPSKMNQLDRFLISKYSPFFSKRRIFTLASCLILAMGLGVLGYFRFYVAGDITLFSEKYNLGRLTAINDLYFNGDIYKTIEENKPSQDPTAAPVPPPQSSSSSSFNNNAAPLPDSITGGSSSSTGSGAASGGGIGIGAPQAPVGNVQQTPSSNAATSTEEGDDSNVFEGPVSLAPPSSSSPNGSSENVGSSNVSGDGGGQEETTTNSQSSASSSSSSTTTTPVNVVGTPLLGGSDKDLRRVEAISIRLIFGVDPPDGSGSYQLWKLSGDKARSIGIHGDLQNSGSSIDVSSPEVQSLLFNTVSKARSDTSLHLLAKTTWIEILHDYALSDPLLEDFPIPQQKFESYIQRLAALDQEFAKQINQNLGTTSPGTAGRYTFAGLSIQVDAVASLEGSPSTELSEIVYQRFTEFSNAVNTEAMAHGEDVPTLVVQSSIFLDAYRVDATIESTILTWVVANGLCLLVILTFTHNVALSCMVMATIILILLCLNGLLFGIAKIPFGPVEALGVSIFIGLSANYSLHVVHAYQHSKAKTQSSKAHYALYAVGSPIVASALSTMGASAFLFGCRTWVFIELGILLLCITSMALLYSMTFLLAWLSLAGPRPYVNEQGKTVHRWDIKELLYGCFCRRKKHDAQDAAAVDAKGQCLELANAVQKESISAGETSRRSRKPSQRTSSAESLMSTQASIDGSSYSVYSATDSVQMSVQPTTLEDSENGGHRQDDDDDGDNNEEDDYSIEVTSDDEN